MSPHDAERLAVSLMRQHGLLERGWRFRFSSGRQQLGAAEVREQPHPYTGRPMQIKTIRLSRHLVRLNGEAEVRDTILHEIAHALAGPEHGHGPKWRAICHRIGARPQRLADETVITPPPRYELVCQGCRQVIARRHRRASIRWLARAYCLACGPTTTGRLHLRDRQAPAGPAAPG